jgi:hypothetical protein
MHTCMSAHMCICMVYKSSPEVIVEESVLYAWIFCSCYVKRKGIPFKIVSKSENFMLLFLEGSYPAVK